MVRVATGAALAFLLAAHAARPSLANVPAPRSTAPAAVAGAAEVAGARGRALSGAGSRPAGLAAVALRGEVPGPSLGELQGKYNALLARGLTRLRANKAPGEEHIVGDSTDAAGMYWTKCTNLAVDLIDTLVAEERGLVTAPEAREHVRGILAILGGLRTYHGIFPEIVQIDNGIRAEVKAGRVRYSSVDSAWVTLALTLVEARYQTPDDEAGPAGVELGTGQSPGALSEKARALTASQDYGVFVGADGLLGGGFWVDARTYQKVADFGFSYGDQNSEARPLVLALVGMGKLPASAFDNMRATWALKEGLPVLRGWRWSAFVEMTGELWLDEMALAPLSLGQSHANYIEATTRVARRLGHAVWGYAPACDIERGYSEYGLDRAELVSPYAAGLLAMTGDARALANLERSLAGMPSDGRPMPDGLDPRTGHVVCEVARTLDQSLLFLSLNVDVVRALARRTTWYASAEQRTRELDRTSQPPAVMRTAEASPALGQGRPSGAGAGAGTTGAAAAPTVAAAPGPGAGAIPSAGPLVQVLDAVRRSESTVGGPAALARSAYGLASARTTRAWADFTPDLAVSIRHPLDQSLTEPAWRTVLQARAALSLEKVWTAVAAGDAEDTAGISVKQSERDGWLRGFAGYFELYLAERRRSLLEEHRASLAAFAAGLSGGERPGSLNDVVLLRSRLSALDAFIADAEASRRLALGRLQALTGAPIRDSGLDPHLDLGQVLGLMGQAMPAAGVVAADEERAAAELERQRSLVSQVASRGPYVPELRAGAFVDIPRGDLAGEEATPAQGWTVDRVTGALSLAFNVRAAHGLEREAQARAFESSALQLDQVREARAAVVAEARARLRASLATWSAHAEAAADALYRDTGESLKRGEVDVAALLGASRTFVDARDSAERVFVEAVGAAIALAGAGASPVGATETGPVLSSQGGPVPAVLSRAEVDALGSEAARAAPAVRAADAEAARARAEALRVSRDSWRVGFEAGVAYPFYTRSGAAFDQTLGPPMTFGAVALATERIGEPTLLGRLSVELKGNRAQVDAADAEAALRAAQDELARKGRLADQARARLELAYAEALEQAAANHASFCAEQLRLARQMQAAGLLDEKNLLREAELRAGVAEGQWQDARAALDQAQLRANQLLGRPLRAPLAIRETPEELAEWLRGAHFPSLGLVGYRDTLGLEIAALEQRRADRQLQALREPPRAVDLTVQASDQLRGYGHSVGVALGLRLDPPRNPSKVLEAARLAGESAGRAEEVRQRLARERRLADVEIAAAKQSHELELESRGRLATVLEELRRDQAVRPELHESSKARSLGVVQERLQEVDLRVLESSARLARARLIALELGGGAAGEMPSGSTPALAPPGASPPAPLSPAGPGGPAPELEGAIRQLVEREPGVVTAGAAAQAVTLEYEHRAPAILSGAHLAGPFVGGSYGIGRSDTGANTSLTIRDVGGSVAAGLTYDLDEGLSFLGTRRLERSAESSLIAAHHRAEVGAFAGIAELWKARDMARLAAERASENTRRLESLAIPRYRAAQLGAQGLTEATIAAAGAESERRRTEAVFLASRAGLRSRGVSVSDAALDDFAHLAAPELAPPPAAVVDAWEKADLDASGPELAAEAALRDSASAEEVLAFSRILGPTTLSIELDPQARRTTTTVLDAQQIASQRRLTWVSSLYVPFGPRALAEGGEAGALVDVRRAEAAAHARALRESFADTRLRLEVGRNQWEVAERGRKDAGLALAEVNRRYRGALGGATGDSLAQAEDDVFDAEAHERATRADLMSLLAPIRRRQGAPATPPAAIPAARP
jgi:hypothetical protein